jgi:hypothetical protein
MDAGNEGLADHASFPLSVWVFVGLTRQLPRLSGLHVETHNPYGALCERRVSSTSDVVMFCAISPPIPGIFLRGFAGDFFRRDVT